ncbi:MAG: DUF1616 domain-containing protein [Asgard group archaeon]|nr:DUF1616 domain-containing protein [Asgard group archaeon]
MNKQETNGLKKIIQKTLADEKPKTVRELVKKTIDLTGKSKEEIYSLIQELEKTKTIRLGSPKIKRILPETLYSFVFKLHYFSIEFWLIGFLILIFFPIIIFIPPDSPILFLRVIMGILFGIFIPGWVITNILFPRIYEKIDQTERVLISIGINIGISIFTGLILNTVWIIDSIPFVIVIGCLTIVALLISTAIRILLGSNRHKVVTNWFNSLFKKSEMK